MMPAVSSKVFPASLRSPGRLTHRELSIAESLSPIRAPYTLQAALAARHARARVASDTDWTHIVSLYGELLSIEPTPIVALNRALAVSMAEGPKAALALLDEIASKGHLRDDHLLPRARAEMLEKLGQNGEAKQEFERATSDEERAPNPAAPRASRSCWKKI
jgi:predicted RNA polymerase sigma factor